MTDTTPPADPWHLMVEALIDPQALPPEPARRGPYLHHVGAGLPAADEHQPWRVDFEIPPDRQRGTVRRFDAAGFEQLAPDHLQEQDESTTA